MRRFQIIETEQNLMDSIVEKLIEIGYTKIQDFNGGDDDFILIDTMNKEFLWCEFGSRLGDIEYIKTLEYSQFPEYISLFNIRFE